jgi:hypothetical protein
MTKADIITKIESSASRTGWPYLTDIKIDPRQSKETKDALAELVREGVLSKHRTIRGFTYKLKK